MPTQSKSDIEPSGCSPVGPTPQPFSLALTILAMVVTPGVCRAQSRPVTAKAASPGISTGGVVSASAFGGFASVAPGSWIEIYGSNLASDTRGWTSADFAGDNAPTSLDGTSVTIGGQSAFVDYISPTQVDVQLPSNVATGSQPVIVTAGGVQSSPAGVTVNAAEPGLLAPSSFDIGGKQYVVALFLDGAYVLPPGSIAGVTSRRAQPGDTITLYGVGFGPVIPNIAAGQIVQEDNALALPFQLSFGPAQAAVAYDGLAPDAVGLYQFNVTVPNVAGSDTVPVTFTLGGVAGTQTLYISIQSGNTAAQVQSLTLSPTSVAGGGTVQGTVALSAPATSGGAIVALSSNSTAATVPSTVTVPAAATSANFTISTGTVSSSQSVIITATYGGGSSQAMLTVTQAAATNAVVQQISILSADFFPVGYPAIELGPILVSANPALNPADTTYTAQIGDSLAVAIGFLNGVASNQNQTFTFSTLENGSGSFSFPGGPNLTVSSATLIFTLGPPTTGSDGPGGADKGGLTNATLSFTGTPVDGGASVTISGPITGTYIAEFMGQ